MCLPTLEIEYRAEPSKPHARRFSTTTSYSPPPRSSGPPRIITRAPAPSARCAIPAATRSRPRDYPVVSIPKNPDVKDVPPPTCASPPSSSPPPKTPQPPPPPPPITTTTTTTLPRGRGRVRSSSLSSVSIRSFKLLKRKVSALWTALARLEKDRERRVAEREWERRGWEERAWGGREGLGDGGWRERGRRGYF